MTTQTMTKCNHQSCIITGKNRPAAYKVTQHWANGNESVTYVCEDNMYHMSKVLKDTDTVIKL